MTYSQNQIEAAKINYTNFLQLRSVESYNPELIGWAAAEERYAFHNDQVTSILNGDKELEKSWKLFFLQEIVKSEKKANESKLKLEANKAASADILAPIKSAKKLGEFGKWLNTSGNPFRSQHFSKKYTIEAVNTFLSL